MKNIFLILIQISMTINIYANAIQYSANPEESKYTLVRSMSKDLDKCTWFVTSKGITKYEKSKWSNYTTSNSGLSSNNVRAIAVDKNNVKWFATDKGFTKFDGLQWTSYSQNDGLVNNMVNCISLDEQGNKWFGTQAGISMFDGVHWMNYTTSNGLIDQIIKCSLIDRNNNKWFGTTQGVSMFNGSNWIHFTHSKDKAFGIVESIAIDSLGHIWIGTHEGIIKLIEEELMECNFNSSLRNGHMILEQKPKCSRNISASKKEREAYKFDPEVWTYYTTENGVIKNHLSTIDVDEYIMQSDDQILSKNSNTSSSIDVGEYQTGNIRNIQKFLSLTDDMVYLLPSLDQHLVTVYNGAGKMIYIQQNEFASPIRDLEVGYYQISFKDKQGDQKIVNEIKFK